VPARGSRGRDYDLVVVGGGTAGMSAARTARRRQARVALVSDGPIGGDCTFTGCIPSKTLIESAARGDGFATAMEQVRTTVAAVAATETADVLRAEGIDVVEERARWLGPGRLDAGGVLRAARVVLAVGARPALPAIPGLGGTDPLTNETVFDLVSRPASLLVLGGGPVGVELAQAFARLGTAVTVVEAAGRILPAEEPEASAVVAAALGADGVRILTGAVVTGVTGDATGASVTVGATVLHAARVLAATGRRPATDDLGLELAGVECDRRGFVRTDDRLRTTAAGVWAAGDVAGRSLLTHAADEMGRVAATNALARVAYRRYRDDRIPHVTFTDPEAARVGCTEDEAARRPGARVAYLPMTEVDRARTAGRTDGYVKLVVAPRTGTGDLAGGRLVGATVVAARAGEMIHVPTLVLRSGMLPARLALATQAYPTWSLAVQQAAAQLFVETGGRRARPARRDPV
jgi:pyruvate/2-oxoglutarate dehydrogenase complex dihydrolipoamide dehydrogenase (E3) component